MRANRGMVGVTDGVAEGLSVAVGKGVRVASPVSVTDGKDISVELLVWLAVPHPIRKLLNIKMFTR